MNCLANVVPTHYDPRLVEYHLRTPPGQLFNIDRQCQYIHNSASSFYCGVGTSQKGNRRVGPGGPGQGATGCCQVGGVGWSGRGRVGRAVHAGQGGAGLGGAGWVRPECSGLRWGET